MRKIKLLISAFISFIVLLSLLLIFIEKMDILKNKNITTNLVTSENKYIDEPIYYRVIEIEYISVNTFTDKYNNNSNNTQVIRKDSDFLIYAKATNLTQTEFNTVSSFVDVKALTTLDKEVNQKISFSFQIPANYSVNIVLGYRVVKTTGILYRINQDGEEILIKDVIDVEWVYETYSKTY